MMNDLIGYIGIDTPEGTFAYPEVKPHLVIQHATRAWCHLPYPGHPKGCPNVGKSSECPPDVPLVEDKFDLSYPSYFAIERFDLAAHAARMKEAHPSWSDRQCRCVLYWQNGVRKRLRKKCAHLVAALHFRKGYAYTLIPEAMGVNVFRTCHRIGIKMRKNPQNEVIKVGFIAKLRSTS